MPWKRKKKPKKLAKRSRGRSKIERDLVKQIKGKAAATSSSSDASSSDALSSSDLEAVRPSRKKARDGRPSSDSDSAAGLVRAVSQVSVQVGRICSFLGFGVRRAL